MDFFATLRGWFGNEEAKTFPPKKHIIFFDFDRTLTVVHVFKSLAGWVDAEVGILGGMGAVPAPHATTERGQLMRLCELGPAWIEQAFGGFARVAEVRRLLKTLSTKHHCTLILITRGYIAVASKCLLEIGVLEYFSDVYGNVDSAYDRTSAYDHVAETKDLPPGCEKLFGDDAHGKWTSKAFLMLQYKENQKLEHEDIIFIDDDYDEIHGAMKYVSTVHVKGPAGITVVEVMKILQLAGLGRHQKDSDFGKIVRVWTALPDPLACRPPPIMVFNRAHLPVFLARHLAALEVEFQHSRNPVQRVNLLLNQPLLLLAVAQREFVRQHIEGNTFSVESMKPMFQCMEAQIGLEEENVELMSDVEDMMAAETHRHNNEIRNVYSETEYRQAAASGSDVQDTQRKHLYRAPAQNQTQTAPQTNPTVLLHSAVATIQRKLLGLIPATLEVSGRKALIGCHDAVHVSTQEAVWGRYSQSDVLGSGELGEVFKAVEKCSGKTVAVKSLDQIEHVHGQARINDVAVLKALAHPNLIRIFEAVAAKDKMVVISEFSSGGSLSDFSMASSSITWVRGSMKQILSAVAYCHQHNILHGDLKPENVLVAGLRPDKSPLCLVCDFGHTSICIGPQSCIAAPGDVRYIAPEVLGEEFLSPKSDVYMLGVSAYELLTRGRLPFFGQKVTKAAAHVQVTLGPLRERILSHQGISKRDWLRMKHAPSEAQRAVKGMLERYETNRPTAREVLGSDWLGRSNPNYVQAYEKMHGKSGWGLWKPEHEHFAKRLHQRASQSHSYRTLLTLVSLSLDTDTISDCRLFFRRLQPHGTGEIGRKEFQAIAKDAGLDMDTADLLFDSADLHKQHFLDFKNVTMLLIDLDSFTDEQMLCELQSVLNHMRGPHSSDSWLLGGGTGLKNLMKDIRQHLNEGDDLTAEVLLRILRNGSL